MRKTFARLAATLLLLAFLLLSAPLSALAEGSDYPAPLFPPDNPGGDGYRFILNEYGDRDFIPGDPQHDNRRQDLALLKRILREKGYYEGLETTDEVLQGVVYDSVTHRAAQLLCEQNDISFPETARSYGMPDSTWFEIKQREAEIVDLSSASAPAAEKHRIIWGETGPDVMALQERLIELGFDRDLPEGERLPDIDPEAGAAVYREPLQHAVDLFLAVNPFGTYDQRASGGLTPELQDYILNSKIVSVNPTPAPEVEETPEPTPVPDFPERTRNYFTGYTHIGSLEIRTYIVWIVCFVILVLIVLAIIYFFVPASDKEPNQSRTRRRHGGRQIEFTITYGDRTEVYTCIITKALHIGRNVGSFPLNLEDADISRRHCELYYLNDRLMLRDYSTNGTKVNDRLVKDSEVQLNSGDRLVIGRHKIIVTF